jgi:molecular chaperone GrpE
MIKQDKTEFKSEQKNYTFGISQKAIIYDPQEEKYLLIKTQGGYYAEKYGPWELVGGTVDAGEDFKKALEREIKEEAGEIEYEVCDLVSDYKIFNSDGKEKIFLGSLVKFLGGEIKLSEEHEEYKWEKYKDILENKEYKPWLKEFIQKAQEYIEKENNLAGWKRCQADFENYKKRQETLQWELAKYSGLNLIMQILPVLDNFHAATDHIPADQKEDQWVVGIMYIQKQLEKILEDNGVKEIKTKAGDDFDPKIHEAVHNANEKVVKNKITKVVVKGYKMEEKVVRAARVIVS